MGSRAPRKRRLRNEQREAVMDLSTTYLGMELEHPLVEPSGLTATGYARKTQACSRVCLRVRPAPFAAILGRGR